MLTATGVTKRYGDIQALAGADLAVEAGQVVSLLGRNGAGKSTLLSIVAGLLAADGGSVSIGGIDALAEPSAASKLLGIAPQDTGVYPVLTVRQNLEFFGELAGLGRSLKKQRAEHVAERLGLEALLERRAGKLSGGEVRRLHTACALVHTPKLLMLDEPTVGADVETRRQLIDAVRELASEGAAVIYTTHYMPEVVALEADLVIIDKGRVLASGSQAELVDQHSTSGVRFTTDGYVPSLTGPLEALAIAPDTYTIAGDVTISQTLTALGAASAHVLSVEAIRPDLETVFLSVTGSSLDDELVQP